MLKPSRMCWTFRCRCACIERYIQDSRQSLKCPHCPRLRRPADKAPRANFSQTEATPNVELAGHTSPMPGLPYSTEAILGSRVRKKCDRTTGRQFSVRWKVS